MVRPERNDGPRPRRTGRNTRRRGLPGNACLAGARTLAPESSETPEQTEGNLTAPAVESSRGWRMGCVDLSRTGDRLLALSKAIVAAPSGPCEAVAITHLGGEG